VEADQSGANDVQWGNSLLCSQSGFPTSNLETTRLTVLTICRNNGNQK